MLGWRVVSTVGVRSGASVRTKTRGGSSVVGKTLTEKSSGDAVDVPVSQGRWTLDDAENGEAACASTPLVQGGMATPDAGGESEDCQSEGRPPSQTRQAPCYSPLIRRRTSLVQMPSSPALPPMPVTASCETGVQPRGVDIRLPDTGEGYGPAGGRRQSTRIAARNQAAAASLGLVPDASSGGRGAPGQAAVSKGKGQRGRRT